MRFLLKDYRLCKDETIGEEMFFVLVILNLLKYFFYF